MSYPPPVNPQQPYQPPAGPQQQPQWQGPQHGQYMPPPKKKSSASLIIGVIVAVVVVLCGGGVVLAALAGDPATTTNTTGGQPAGEAPAAQEKQEDAPKTYKIGQTVRGGDFEFTVHSNKCGIAQVGNEFLNHKAQGSFCRIDITVKNVTKSAHLFHADTTVKAKAGDVEYSPDGEAGIYGNKEGAGFLDEINPGNKVRALVFFDVPKGTKLTSLVFDAGLLTLAEDAVVTL